MKFLFNYKYTLITALCILYLSLMKPPKSDISLLAIENIDKLIHILMYASLSFAIVTETKFKNKPIYLFFIFIISTIFGGAIEILQNYFPPRTASWGDFAADAIGSALPLVILIFLWFKNYGRNKKSKANCADPDRGSKQ